MMYLLFAIVCLGVGQLLLNGAGGLLRATALIFQFAGVLCALHAYRGPDRRGRHRDSADGTRHASARRHWRLTALGGLLALGVVLRAFWLDRLPFRIDGDAAAFALASTNFLGPDPPELFATGWQAHTNLYFWINAQMLQIFGRSAVGVRALSALGGSLAVLAVWELGRSLVNHRVGLFAALALAVMPMHLVFSRVGTEVVQLTWLLPAVIVMVWRGWRALQRGAATAGRGWLLLGGALTGLSQYVYPGARLIPILVLILVALLCMDRWEHTTNAHRLIRDGAAALGWLVLGFTVVYGPMVRYYLDEPWTYFARLEIVSITASGWLEAERQQRALWRILLDQAWRAYLPLVYPVGGPRLWYVWPRFLSAIDAALLLLGLIAGVYGRQLRRWLRRFLIAVFVLGFALAGVLTIDTPMPSRYVVFLPFAALLIGLGMEQLATGLLRLLGAGRHMIGQGLLGGALLAYVLGNIAAYVQHDTVDTWSIDEIGQLATFATRAMHTLPDDAEILFLSTPLEYFDASPVLPLLTRRVGSNHDEAISCFDLAARQTGGATFVVAPAVRLDELRQLYADTSQSELEIFRKPNGDEVGGVLVLPPPDENPALCRQRG